MTTLLNFETIDEYSNYMETARAEICSCTIHVLEEAYLDKEDHPSIMTAAITGEDQVYEMSLSRSQWPIMLEKCLEILSESDRYADDAIDAYLLLEKLKQE